MSLNLRDTQLYSALNEDINNLLDKYINSKGIDKFTKKDIEIIQVMINCASNSKINRDSKEDEDALIDEDNLERVNNEIITEYNRFIENVDIIQKTANVTGNILTDTFLEKHLYDFFYLSMIANRLDILYFLKKEYLTTTNFRTIKGKI